MGVELKTGLVPAVKNWEETLCLSVTCEEHILRAGDWKASLHTKREMLPRPAGLQPQGHRGGEGGSGRRVIWVAHCALTRS